MQHGGHVVQTHRLNLCTPLHTAARGGHVEVVRYVGVICRLQMCTFKVVRYIALFVEMGFQGILPFSTT